MATSGTYSQSWNKNNILTKAFQLTNLYDLHDDIDAVDMAYASDLLNLVLQYWSGQEIKMWKRKIAYLFPSYLGASYTLGNTSTTKVTNAYAATTVAQAASAAATTITLASVTGMSVSDNIGIELNDGTRQWTTISAINTGTKVVTLNAALSDDASISSTVITYTSSITRPERIIRGTVLDLTNNTETTMQPISFDEYFNMPLKGTQGQPNNFYYDKQEPVGTLYLFPTPDSVKKVVTFSYLEPIQDAGDITDEIDIPKAWTLPLIYALGVELCYAYRDFVSLDKIKGEAVEKFETIKFYNSDDQSVRLGNRD